MFSVERLGPLLVELVEDPALEELLVGDADLRNCVTTRPQLSRRRSDGRVDGVGSTATLVDAVAAILKSSSSFLAPSQHLDRVVGRAPLLEPRVY